MGKWLCPSMMCADFGNMEKEIEVLQACGIDYFHLDVMDGQFVRNFGMGLQDIDFIASKATAKTEVHLMITEPSNHVERFIEAGVDRIFIHPDSDFHPARVLQTINNANRESGIVLSPGTSVESILDLLNIADCVMVMMVNPGFAGQGYLPYVEKKIHKLLELKEEYDFEIILDGACSKDVIKKFYPLGVKGFVIGTSALFNKNKSYEDSICELRMI